MSVGFLLPRSGYRQLRLAGELPFLLTRAVKVSALIYAINVAAINALKYFNAINATLFTSGVRCPLTRNRRVPT